MKVIQETKDKLSIKHRPMTSFFPLVIIAFVWLINEFTFSKFITLECEKVANRTGTCLLQQTNLFARIERSRLILIEDLEKVYVSETKDSDFSGKFYQIILLTHEEPIPFTEYSSSNSKFLTYAEKINNFLKNESQKSLSITIDNQGLDGGDIFSIIMLIIFSVCFWCSFFIQIDKKANKVTLIIRRLVTKKMIEENLDEINFYLDDDGEGTRLMVTLPSGKQQSLLPYHDGLSKANQEIMNKISNFLNLDDLNKEK